MKRLQLFILMSMHMTYGFDRGMFSHQGLQRDLLLHNLHLRHYFRLTSTGAIQQITQQIGT